MTIIRNQQGSIIGSILSKPDANGNPRFETSSRHRPDAVMFWSKTAATFWLDVVDELVGSRMMRSARS